MSSSAPIVTVGSINADLYVVIERLPLPGETLPGRDAAVRPGGKGANQAAAVARLGRASRFIGQVGEDAFAPDLRRALSTAGVDVSALASVPGATGQALILLQRGGENSIILVGGANQAWPASPQVPLAGAAAVLLQREIPEAVNLAVARAAVALGVPVVLDCGGSDAPLPDELLRHIAVLSPNETELARLTGDDDIERSARTLLARGVGAVLVKLGSHGSLLIERDRAPLRQGVFPVSVVDTTGAGDCFTAAYAVALVEGRQPAERLRFAAAAAALCVTRLGAMPAMPTRAEVDALLAAGRH
jgi:ribokinase